MKYLVVSEAGQPIKCQCNGELYLALAMENLSLTDGYQVQPCSMAAKRKRARCRPLEKPIYEER